MLERLECVEMVGDVLRVVPPVGALEAGSAWVCFTVVYRWRPEVLPGWEVETPRWGLRMMDEAGLRRMAQFSQKPFELLVAEKGIDLTRPDRAARAGAGAEFYAELMAGAVLCDAYYLGESEELGTDDAGEMGFYGKRDVALYVKDTRRVDMGALAVNLRMRAGAYDGKVWLGDWVVENVALGDFPPEFLVETAAGARSFVAEEAASSGGALPVDKDLIPAGRRALAYMRAVAAAGCMLYGVQNFPYSKGGTGYPGAPADTSDVFDLMGSDPAVFGLDSLSLVGHEGAHRVAEIVPLLTEDAGDAANIPHYVRGCVLRSAQAWARGSISTLSLHMGDVGMIYDDFAAGNVNRVTGRPLFTAGARWPWNFFGYNYGNSCCAAIDARDGRARSAHRPMLRMYRALTGTGDAVDAGTLGVYEAYLDLCVEYCLGLQALEIPVLFRPFHENSGDWFWWGNAGCEDEAGQYAPEIFKRVWQHCVQYMMGKGVHNCIYVYSPNGSDFDNEAKLGTHAFRPYAITYPGDDFVDICAFDDYTQDEAAMRGDVETVTRFAGARGKLAGAAEVTGSATDSAVMDYLIRALGDTAHLPVNMAFFLQWTQPTFAPYLISPTRTNSGAGNGFIRALSSKKILLARDTRW